MYDYSIKEQISVQTLEDGRTYHTPQGSFPSITTILGKTSNDRIWLDKWKAKVGEQEASRISKLATDRGELIHSYLEQYWNQKDISHLDNEKSDIIQMTNDLIKISKSGITQVWAQEVPVWSEKLRIAGRLDLVGLWKGRPAIIDFKTTNKKKSIIQIKDYLLQSTFYAVAHNEMFGSDIQRIVILITVENNEPLVYELSCIPLIPELKWKVNQFYKQSK